ncbi:hypothetical protein GCM10010336_71250 [Streptomyces goshikiensis]|nr:hypothetical protein GCM10010336_71250 [Streptomyces goshikiensis]
MRISMAWLALLSTNIQPSATLYRRRSAAGQSLPGAMCLLVAAVATSILFLTDQALVVYLSATAFCACTAHIALVSARQLLIGAGRARRAAPLVPAPASRRRVRPRAHRRAGR